MKENLAHKNKKPTGDYLLLISVIALAIIGTVFIYSASNYSANATYNDSFYFVKKQLIGILLGAMAMVFTCNFNYEKLKKWTIPVSIVSFVTLVLVFVPGIGVENYGAKRWINLGFSTLQPSEIAKFSLILFSATYFSKDPSRAKSFVGILPVLIYGLVTCSYNYRAKHVYNRLRCITYGCSFIFGRHESVLSLHNAYTSVNRRCDINLDRAV